jgi:spore germination protein GerM
MRRLFLLMAALALVAGCGVPKDHEPRDISAGDQLRLGSNEGAEPRGGNAIGPKVYFLTAATTASPERLQPASRDVAPVPEAVLRELFRGLAPEERSRRWRTAIPADTQLLSATQQGDGTLVVDVNDAIFGAQDDAQIKAVAQIVFTAVGIDGVDRVQLLVDGQTRDWPRGDGELDSDPLNEFAYPELNPTSQPDYPPLPPPVTVSSG